MSEHDVFISYARSTEATARKLGEALRAEGFSVWRDDDLPPHRAYAEVIEERLRDAAAVVVLWSADAARSQWVRAEADIARNAGRLVQVRIEEIEPPIPFNQIQCLDFSRWRGGRTTAGWRKLVESITALRDGQAAGAWFAFGQKAYAPEPPTLQVADFAAPEELRQAASGMTDQMIRVLSGAGVATARSGGPPPQTVGPLYRLEGAIEKSTAGVAVTSRLTNVRTGLLIWSWKFDRSNVDQENFFRHVAEDSTAVLHCAIDDRKYATSPITDTAFGLYLNACAAILAGGGAPRMLAAARRLVQAAPNFASAYAMQAIAAAMSLREEHSPPERDALVSEGESAVKHALALNPRVPKAWMASALLRGPHGLWLEREHDLREAIRLDPNLPPPKTLYLWILRETGRFREAAQLRTDLAGSADPRDGGGGYEIAAQYWSDAGDREKANDALTRLEESFPGSGGRIRFELALRYGSRPEALSALTKVTDLEPVEVRCLSSWIEGQNETLDAKRKGLPAPCGRATPQQRLNLLAREGDIDAVFAELEPYLFQKRQPPTVLFAPELRAVRADPRFLAIVKRLGLSDYWSRSGNWPDFCQAPDRPYDCRRLV